MKKLTKSYIFDIIAAVLLLALAICIMVIPNFGKTVLQYLVAAALLLYLILFLFPEFRSANGHIQIFMFVEMLLIMLVAVGLVFTSLKLINLGSTCQIFGAILWLRGVGDALRCFYARGTNSARSYPIWQLLLSILILSFGIFLIARPFISDAALVFVMGALLILAALMFVYLFVRELPKKGAKGSKKKSEAKAK